MTDLRHIRPATAEDGAACARIYAPYVTDSAITFELEPPSGDTMAERIETATRKHAWLVIEDEHGVFGYAYAGAFHPRAAYRWSCEVSVYLDRDRRGSGAGRALYEELLAVLRRRGYRQATACITLPNPASERLHERFGFAPVGVFRDIGWKDDRWHDVAWSQLDLVADAGGSTAPGEIA